MTVTALTHDDLRTLANDILKLLGDSDSEKEFQDKLMCVAAFNTNLISFLLVSGAPDLDTALEGLEAYKRDVAANIIATFGPMKDQMKTAAN